MNCQCASGLSPNDCSTQGGSRRNNKYCKYLKPFFSFVVSVLLALSMSHLCEKYSTSNSFENVRSDLSTLRNNLNLLMEEVRTLMESKDEFKNQLTEVSLVVPKLSEAILHLRAEISEVIETHANKLEQSAGNLKDLVRTELEAFSEDHAGKTDYALELLGGTVLTVRDTQTYDAGAPQLKIFGMAICAQQNTPRAIIQANTLPGECWAIKGDKGVAVIQLIGPVRVSGFSLEHISATIAPTGETSTAPKDFSVWGLNDIDDTNGFLFGEYRYDNSGVRVQYFQAKNEPNKSYEIVELKIHSNSGNTKYTCIYRFRVHGNLTSQQRGIS